MSDKLKMLTPSERFIFEWQYRMLGGFRTALVETIAKADTDNRERLRRGFPEEVAGYVAFAETPGWWKAVERKAGVPE